MKSMLLKNISANGRVAFISEGVKPERENLCIEFHKVSLGLGEIDSTNVDRRLVHGLLRTKPGTVEGNRASSPASAESVAPSALQLVCDRLQFEVRKGNASVFKRKLRLFHVVFLQVVVTQCCLRSQESGLRPIGRDPNGIRFAAVDCGRPFLASSRSTEIARIDWSCHGTPRQTWQCRRCSDHSSTHSRCTLRASANLVFIQSRSRLLNLERSQSSCDLFRLASARSTARLMFSPITHCISSSLSPADVGHAETVSDRDERRSTGGRFCRRAGSSRLSSTQPSKQASRGRCSVGGKKSLGSEVDSLAGGGVRVAGAEG